jgi:hypothetical protein
MKKLMKDRPSSLSKDREENLCLEGWKEAS